MEYIAHFNEEHSQTIKDHLYGTAKLAGDFAERFGKADWGYCCGMLHDIGSIPTHFRRRLRIIAIKRWIIRQQEQKSVLKKVECTGS